MLSFELNFFFLEEKYCNLQNPLIKYWYTGTNQLIKIIVEEKNVFFFSVLHVLKLAVSKYM